MKKIYYLDTCSTCKRILKELNDASGFELQNIKSEPMEPEQLDFLKEKVGSYEELFSRRAMKFRAMGLHERELGEQDYRDLILEEYTFLKRPVIVVEGQVYVGSAKKTVAAVKEQLGIE